MVDPDLLQYYSDRVAEYEDVYDRPERAAHLEALESAVTETLAGHDVIELACGTGYWTERVSQTADSVVAMDASRAVLREAASKSVPGIDVAFVQADAYAPPVDEETFTAGFAGFWWSHVPRNTLDDFLRTLHETLAEGARVCFVDNRFVEGSSTPISRSDGDGNTYQRRQLQDGSTYTVLKNFPSAAELRDAVAPHAAAIEVRNFTDYWLLTYRLA